MSYQEEPHPKPTSSYLPDCPALASVRTWVSPVSPLYALFFFLNLIFFNVQKEEDGREEEVGEAEEKAEASGTKGSSVYFESQKRPGLELRWFAPRLTRSPTFYFLKKLRETLL